MKIASASMKLCFSLALAGVMWLYPTTDAHANEQTFASGQNQVSVDEPTRIEGAYVVDRDAQRALNFDRFAQQWRAERGASSSVTKAITSPAYYKIIGMGPEAVPLIVQRMRSEGDDPDLWFWALQSITGEDPTTQEDQGDSVRMAGKWLAWYDENYTG